MQLTKLVEAIDELESKKALIDKALTQMKSVLDSLTEEKSTAPPVNVIAMRQARVEPELNDRQSSSYVKEAAQLSEQAGRALHISAIVDGIAALRGEKPSRAAVESSLIRHTSKSKNPRIFKDRTAPSHFGSVRLLPVGSEAESA